MKKKNMTVDKPARERVFVPFYPDTLPTMPEHNCGVTFTFPENLYRPLPELWKVFDLCGEQAQEYGMEGVTRQ